MVLLDNVLSEANIGTQIRADLMNRCDLHTILLLPMGIFYAQTVKTIVLFFSRGEESKEKDQTKAVWMYDLRAGMPSFGKRTKLGPEHFADFEAAYGKDPYGRSPRKDTGPTGRFRRFSRKEIRARGDSLDLAWLKDKGAWAGEDLPDPEHMANRILEKLKTVTAELEALRTELRGSA